MMNDFFMSDDEFSTAPEQSSGGFGLLPVGYYDVEITNVEIKNAKSGPNNFFTKLTMRVLSGPYANRLLWDNINHRNDNARTQKFGQDAIKAIAASLGLNRNPRPDDLLGGRIPVKVIVKAGDRGDENRVFYDVKTGQQAGQQTQQPRPAVPASAVAASPAAQPAWRSRAAAVA